jgi:ABC transporter substrate binding protein (PQQ-dependent alcohol dehydrogenase system)
MHTRFAALLALALLTLSGSVAAQRAEPITVTFGYLSIKDDPRYAQRETYANIVLQPAIDPFAGAETALREARILGRALGVQFALERVEGKRADDLFAGLERLHKAGTRFFLIDAPGEIVAAVAEQTTDRDLLLINVSATDDGLRAEQCATHLLHTAPSLAMLTDAMAQYAALKAWQQILLLQGPLDADQILADAFERSATRFGAKIVARRQFVPTNDPRQRDLNNILLLTSGADYDAVFVADSEGEFGRYFPYQVALPRPVIGSVGLVADAWHWAFERHGAPQLNQRFERVASRNMTGPDWSAWAGVRVLIEAIARTGSTDLDPVEAYLRGDQLSFDMYKGVPGSFRAWDNQLRQPILLHTHDAAIERAPIERFLHPTNYLDTLGVDLPESSCHL